MARLAAFYNAFTEAVLEQRSHALAHFLDAPRKAGDAVVYRNNVFRAAVDALAAAYPSVARLAGRAFFEHAAASFVAATPPRTRTLVGYGREFPEFLARSPQIQGAPYLPDAARLDWAWLEAHLAADAPVLGAGALRDLTPERLAELKFALHPSVRIVLPNWTIYEAWVANRRADGEEQEKREVQYAPAWVILWRFDNEVRHRPLSEAEARFFLKVRDGAALGCAAEAAFSTSVRQASLVFAGALADGLFALTPDIGDELGGRR